MKRIQLKKERKKGRKEESENGWYGVGERGRRGFLTEVFHVFSYYHKCNSER
jgi:hypothetical protein